MANNTYLNTIASALVLNGMTSAMNTATKMSKAEIKKTEEFKQARKDAKTDALVWVAQIKAIKDANPTAADEDVEAAVIAMGYTKAETEDETIERLQEYFLKQAKNEKAEEYAGQLANTSDYLGFAAGYNDALETAANTPAPSTAPSRTYYTSREQYESHRAITINNANNKRGASAMERLDCNLNAFSEHLEVFARKFRR